MNNQYLAQAFPDADGPAELYRQLYKYTDCGPTLGVTFKSGGHTRTLYADRLAELGTWSDMDKRGEVIISMDVSSIVEGVDEDTGTITVEVDRAEETPEEFYANLYAAVEDINSAANDIWNRTHGCPECARHWAGDPNEWSYEQWMPGETPVWSECAGCDGQGTII